MTESVTIQLGGRPAKLQRTESGSLRLVREDLTSRPVGDALSLAIFEALVAAQRALETAMRWAPRSGEKFVRASDEIVAELRANPSHPVTVQIREEPDGCLMLVFTRWPVPAC